MISLRPSRRFLLLSLLGGLLPGQLLAAQPSAPSLLPVALVDSTGIHFDQLFQPNPDHPLPHLRLGAAPSFGQVAVLNRDQIILLLRQHAPGLALEHWSGAPQIKIGRRGRQLSETEITGLLTATLQKEYVSDRGALELRLSRAWTSVLVPDEPLSVKIYDLPATGINASFIIRFDLSDGLERIGTWQLAVQANLWRDVPVARSHLRRGQSLQEADIAVERRDVLSLRDPIDPAVLSDSSLELTENISAGNPVLSRSVRMRPVVRRGHVAEAVIRDGTLNIALKVQVLEDGLPGQSIRVRNLNSKREFHGIVQNENTILISL